MYFAHVFLISSISPADLVPPHAPHVSLCHLPLSPFLFATVAPSTYELKLECFRILIASCTSFPHSCHSRADSDTLEHFTQGYLYLQRQTDRLTGSHANQWIKVSFQRDLCGCDCSFLSSCLSPLFFFFRICANVCLHECRT